MLSGWRKCVLFIVVVAGHVFAIALLPALRPKAKTVPASMTTAFFFVEPTREPISEESDSRPRAYQPLAISISEPIESSAPLAIAPIDWEMQRGQAAAAVARAQEQEYELPSASDLSDLGSTARIFSKPLHNNGDSQRFDTGELATWTNGRCYVTNLPAAVPRLDERAVVQVCKHPDEPVRDDLVKQARPRYLDPAPDTK